MVSRASVVLGLPPSLPALLLLGDGPPSKIIPRISRVSRPVRARLSGNGVWGVPRRVRAGRRTLCHRSDDDNHQPDEQANDDQMARHRVIASVRGQEQCVRPHACVQQGCRSYRPGEGISELLPCPGGPWRLVYSQPEGRSAVRAASSE